MAPHLVSACVRSWGSRGFSGFSLQHWSNEWPAPESRGQGQEGAVLLAGLFPRPLRGAGPLPSG